MDSEDSYGCDLRFRGKRRRAALRFGRRCKKGASTSLSRAMLGGAVIHSQNTLRFLRAAVLDDDRSAEDDSVRRVRYVLLWKRHMRRGRFRSVLSWPSEAYPQNICACEESAKARATEASS